MEVKVENIPKEELFLVTFNYTSSDGVTISYTFSDWNCTKIKWTSFMENFYSNKKFNIDFCNSNGCVGISTKDGKTYFQVSKYGAGGDGSASLKLNNNLCAKAFEDVTKRVYP
jgi:hypothetical protein